MWWRQSVGPENKAFHLLKAASYPATVCTPNLPIPPVFNASQFQTCFSCPNYLCSRTRKIEGEVVVSGSPLFYSIPTQWLDHKIHFQQAIPAPWVTMETLHLKIDQEEWKIQEEYDPWCGSGSYTARGAPKKEFTVWICFRKNIKNKLKQSCLYLLMQCLEINL